jgi:sigma-B regulation protein RsbU (phosphoserine phosphatase)
MTTTAISLDVRSLERLREQDLEEARAIQGSMLPTEPLCTSAVMMSHEFQPVAAVGGDFLDYFQLSDGSLGLYLGDVSGKGLPAAMYAALAVGTLRGVHKTGQSPNNVLALLNKRLLLRGTPRRYAAMQYAVFNPFHRQLHIASAGMPGPFHLSGSKGCEALQLSGIPPGLWDGASYQTHTIRLEPGDSVVFCTDGVTDAFNIREEEFGIGRLCEVCAGQDHTHPTKVLSRIFSALDEFCRGREQHDDMAATVFHYMG